MNEQEIATLRDLGVAPDLVALLPDDVPFVLKKSKGANSNLPPIAATHDSTAALYVAKRCFWVALDPEDARRYQALTGVKRAAPRGNQRTWRLMVHPEEARRADARRHLSEAISTAITRSRSS